MASVSCGLIVVVATYLSSAQTSLRADDMQLHIDAEQKQLSNQSLQIGGLSAGVQPRDLSEQQSKKLTDVFHGTSLHVDVQRCISAESAVTLSNDFVTAFRSANATVGYNNVTTTCIPGITVAVNARDKVTQDFVSQAFAKAGIKFQGLPDPNAASASIVVYVGTKTADSL